MSKTQQVKQYKKQIDQLSSEVANFKQQAQGHMEQVSKVLWQVYVHLYRGKGVLLLVCRLSSMPRRRRNTGDRKRSKRYTRERLCNWRLSVTDSGPRTMFVILQQLFFL